MVASQAGHCIPMTLLCCVCATKPGFRPPKCTEGMYMPCKTIWHQYGPDHAHLSLTYCSLKFWVIFEGYQMSMMYATRLYGIILIKCMGPAHVTVPSPTGGGPFSWLCGIITHLGE